MIKLKVRAVRFALLAGAFLAAPALSQQQQEQFERGAQKADRCVACHGVIGVAENTSFPDLAGQNAGYLALQLERFRSGERYHPLMAPIAQELTDQDIDDLSVYFSQVLERIETETPQDD